MEIQNSKKPQVNQYYKLLQEVGIDGKYQILLIIFCSILFFQACFLALGTPYYFAVSPYTNCPHPYTCISQCTKYACQLPFSQRSQYLNAEINQLKTLGNEYGDYHCQKSDSVQIGKGIYFVGSIFGFLVIGILGDNFGRKITALFCVVVGVIGYLIILFAKTLYVSEVGLFVCGFGIYSSYNIGVTFLSETLENTNRQKILIITQGMFSVGGFAIVFAFYFLKQRKLIFIIFGLIPLILLFIFGYLLVQQTPQFLIKLYSVQKIRKSLRFIAQINNKSEQFDQNAYLGEAHINSLKMQYEQQLIHQERQTFTYFDLFRYPSLRLKTIFLAILFMAVYFLYYAPVMLVNQFGFDFYMNGVVVIGSEFISYFFLFFVIDKTPRRLANIITAVINLLCCIILLFVHTKQICTHDCQSFKIVIELIAIVILRFCASVQFMIVYVYGSELFPVQVATLGLCFCHVFASSLSLMVNQLINLCNKANFPIMLIFCFASFLYFCFSLPLQQTLGKLPTERIQEIYNTSNEKNEFTLVFEDQH